MERINGYQEVLPFKKGDIVLIKKETMVKTVTKGSKPAGRTYKATIHHVLCGTNYPTDDPRHDPSYPVHNPEVVWAGTGGYWSSVDINEVTRG